MLVMLPLLAIAGGITKLVYGKVERTGSKEFKVDKKAFTDKKNLKQKRKKHVKPKERLTSKTLQQGH